MSDLPSYPPDAAEREDAPPSPGGEREYASWGRRAGAYLLDTLIIVVVVLVIALVVGIIVGASSDAETGVISAALLGYLLTLVLPFPYFTFFHCHASSKNPASAMPPGARLVFGCARSTMAQSGSLATWRALFR